MLLVFLIFLGLNCVIHVIYCLVHGQWVPISDYVNNVNPPVFAILGVFCIAGMITAFCISLPSKNLVDSAFTSPMSYENGEYIYDEQSPVQIGVGYLPDILWCTDDAWYVVVYDETRWYASRNLEKFKEFTRMVYLRGTSVEPLLNQ